MASALLRFIRRAPLRRWAPRFLAMAALLLMVGRYAHGPGAEEEGPVPVRCRLPRTDSAHQQLRPYFGMVPPLNCASASPPWVCVQGVTAGLCEALRGGLNSPIVCRYDFLSPRGGETRSSLRAVDDQQVDLQSDVFRVSCRHHGVAEALDWEGTLAGIGPGRPERPRGASGAAPRNASVLVLDFGQLSSATFADKLPLTHAYVTGELRGYAFAGYNSVGPAGGPDALVPLLTGKTAEELRRGGAFTSSTLLDDFRGRGYVTAFVEDGALTAGGATTEAQYFAEKADHQLGSLYEEFTAKNKKHKPFCWAATPRHKVILDWVTDFFDVYRQEPKFVFVAHRELTRNRVVELADEGTVTFLKDMKAKGHLDNTFLFILSDNGNRLRSLGKSQQAKMEERLPYLTIVAPPWLETEFPDSAASLQINTERLVTQLDIHATLGGILDIVNDRLGNRKQRAISLLKEIPGHRTCEEASIPVSFCTCLEHSEVTTWNAVVRRAAGQLVDVINERTEAFRPVCHKAQLVNIERGSKWVPNSELLKGSELSRTEEILAKYFNYKVHYATEELYHIKIETDPAGHRPYFAYFHYGVHEDEFTFNIESIHRNRDPAQDQCLTGIPEELWDICYCQKSNPEQK